MKSESGFPQDQKLKLNIATTKRLVDTCVEFAAKHNIVFNCRKTKAMYFPCKFFKTTDHNLTVNDQRIGVARGGPGPPQLKYHQ